jgi:hypothetical protein
MISIKIMKKLNLFRISIKKIFDLIFLLIINSKKSFFTLLEILLLLINKD